MGGTRFMVQWEEHPSHLATRLGQLLEHQTLVDVTLMCNTHTLRVHRAVLAACSPYFETILQRQLGMHPLIVLKDMQFSVLKSLIEFMYCGETSVTEDNLGALLQAAKFFQVKGLSAMTKEALGLVANKTAVNGDAARKAFVGRPKRVGIQQTFVTSSLKTIPTTIASGSHVCTTGNELPTLPTKTTFQTISKSVSVRPDTQQQTDTAQLLLSLSGSEFPKQTFHTVSKNVRFQHNVSGSTVTSGTLESTIKKEVVGRLPIMTTPNGGVKTTTTTTTVSQQGGQIVENTTTVASTKEDVLVSNPQSVYIAEGTRRRGRPVKRQMNMLFQERVMTDADMALHKEAEASRKALEMLRQEMSSDSVDSNAAATTSTVVVAGATATTTTAAAATSAATSTATLVGTPAATLSVAAPAVVSAVVSTAATTSTAQISNFTADQLQKGLVKQTASGSTKIQVQPAQALVATNSRTITASQTVSTPTPATKSNANVACLPAANPVTAISNKKIPPTTSTLPDASDNLNAGNVAIKVDEGEEMAQQLYQITNEVVQEAPREENVEYQVSTEATEGEGDISGANTNVVYTLADTSNPIVQQYMTALKDSGITKVLLLQGGDGSFFTVDEDVFYNVMNEGGVLHVGDGDLTPVEFIVQNVATEEGETAVLAEEQAGDGAVLTKADETTGEVAEAVEDTGTLVEGEVPQDTEMQVVAEDVVMPCMEEGNCIIPDMEPETGPLVAPELEGIKAGEELNDQNEISAESEVNCEPENKEEIPKAVEVVEEIASGTYEEIATESFMESAPEPDQQAPEMTVTNQESYEEGNVQTCEVPTNKLIQEEVKEPEINQNLMSVEQALQAMMGDGSDTEAEPSHTESQTASKDETIGSGLETVSQPQEKQPTEDLQLVLRSEEGTEDLRFVLSHGEELGKEKQNDDSNTFSLVPSPAIENDLAVEHEVKETTTTQLEAAPQVVVENVAENTSVPLNNELENSSGETLEEQQVQEEMKEAVAEEVLLQQECVAGDVEMDTEVKIVEEELPADNNTEFFENVSSYDLSGESQEVVLLTSNPLVQPSESMPNAASKQKGKESTPDLPAARVKRKASSNDGPDKRFKMCPSEADTIIELPEAEEGDDATVEMVSPASTPEDRREGAALSMPELHSRDSYLFLKK